MATPNTIQALLAGRSLEPAVTTTAKTDKDRVRDMATQFESMLMSQMLKDLQKSMVDDDQSTGFQGGPLGDVVNQELGQALGKAGGFGLGDMLANAMDREGTK